MFVVGDILRNNSQQYPSKIGLVYEEKRFTWHETEARVNRLSQGLLKLGLKKGDGVGLLSRNCHQWIETALSLAKLGLRMVPLNMMLREKELTYIINDSEARLLIVDAQKTEMIKGMVGNLPGVKWVIGLHEDHGFNLDFEMMIQENLSEDPKIPVFPEDLFMTIYTSGTTGHPKGAMLTHANLVAAAICEGYEYRMIPNDVTLTCLPLFFIGGWGSTCLPFLLRGCTQHIVNFDAETVLRLIQDEKITCLIMVPTIINIVTNHPNVRKYDYSSLRSIPFAGSALPVEHWRRAMDVFGNVFLSAYGFTEGCGTVCVLQPEDVNPRGNEKEVRRLASCGRAMVQTVMKLLDEKGREIPEGSEEVGEICVKGPTLLKGYWKLPEATAESLRDGWFYTGDMARRDEDGFFYIVDRKKDMIITGGINVYPREIEEVIYSHTAVMDCLVIGVPDEKWGETIKAVITIKPGMKVTSEEIINLCKENLASYKKPTSVDIVEEMPRTASGKLLKRELRDQYWQGRERKI